MSDILARALTARRESRQVEFKQGFDPTSLADWCEIIKDIVAIANSSGGVILVGVDNGGQPVGSTMGPALALDPASVSDKLHAYTETHFSNFELIPTTKGSRPVLAISIGPAPIPIAFTRPGTYPTADGKQSTAFSRGTVYFRHGAKSEPGTTEDIRRAFESRLEEIRKEWQDGVRKVVTAPTGSSVAVLPAEVVHSPSPTATPIRIVDDESAPAFRLVDPNQTHPYRQMDVLREMKARVRALARLTAYDIYVVRKVHRIDDQERFFYRPKFGSPQYSEDFVQYLIDEHNTDPAFFAKARGQFKAGR